MTDAGEAILAAVIDDPADDLPRLAMADWCEERGDLERGEFIRCQLRLAGMPAPSPRCAFPHWCPCDACGRVWLPPRLRERGLLNVVGRRLLRGLPGVPGPAWAPHPNDSDYPDLPKAAFRRGFVVEVALPCAAWLAHGPALVRAAPLERVTLSDKAPFMSRWERYGGPTPLSWQVPAPLYRLLRGRSHDGEKRYRDDAAALAALSGACLAWARAAAVAPPPPSG